MSKDNIIEVEWVVTEIVWGWNYKVNIEDMWLEVLAKPAGKLRKFNIKIIPWDRVKVELSTYDPTKGRITFRLNNNKKNES